MSFVSELQRRNVVRVALLYVVAGWILLQVSDVLFGAMELPPWTLRLVLGLLLLAFPLVLIFSWAYELTPEGLKRDHEVDRNQSITAETARKLNLLSVVLLVVAVALAVSDRFLLRDTRTAAPVATAPAAPGAPAAVPAGEPSIAVLPFVNMSGDPENEYFSDGLSEELLNVLAQIRGLRVIARTSSFAFKGEKTDIATVAAKLAVAHVLEGSVRKAGDTVRITAQLIRAADSSHLWSQSYERQLADVFAVQDEIAREVAAKLEITLLPGRGGAELGGTRNPQAHDLFLRAIAVKGIPGMREDNERRLALLDEALALDPDFARAHSARSFRLRVLTTNGWLSPQQGYAQARAAVDRALALEPGLGYAYMVRSQLRLIADFDWAGAQADLDRAVELDPGNANVVGAVAYQRTMAGDFDEGLRAIRTAIALDPVSPFLKWNFGAYLRNARRDAEAEQVLKAALADDPGGPNWHYELGQLALQQGDPQRALAEFEAETVDWKLATGRALAYAALGKDEESQRAFHELLKSGDPDWSSYQQAMVHTVRGDKEAAFQALDTALKVHDPALLWTRIDPMFDPLRDDPRFARVLQRMNFPD
jgi:TolB-like protein/Tfp pilus assembly protein PilF